jgi:hypothetical protein
MNDTEHDRKRAGQLRRRLPSDGPDMDELIEVPQPLGAVVRKRR